jgi:4-hydroxy-tetrahydrodipicolinate synthase
MADLSPPAPFGHLLTAMATAFFEDGSVDVQGTAKIARHLVNSGNDGVVVSGTTGESPTTSVKEDQAILAAVISEVGADAKVVAGVGTNSTSHSVELAHQARELGADGVLLVTPYYNKPSVAGVLKHFAEVSAAGALPVMLYDVPGRTGLPIAPEVYREAATWQHVVAVKDATGNYATVERLTRETQLAVYSGDDANILAWLAFGACGLVSVAAHAVSRQLKTLMQQFWAGDHQAALETYRNIKPAFDAIMGVSNYGATTAKGSLQLLGVLNNRYVRGPLASLDDHEYSALADGLKAAGVLA